MAKELGGKLTQVHEQCIKGREALRQKVVELIEGNNALDIKMTQTEFQVAGLLKH
jgi:hypothetical protein